MNEPVAWMIKTLDGRKLMLYGEEQPPKFEQEVESIPLYTHPVKEQDDYCKAYWGNDNKFVDVFLPNSETEVIRFWNNTHPVKEQVETIEYTCPNCQTHVGLHVKHPVKDLEDIDINITWNETSMRDFGLEELMFAKAILRKAQEK